MKISITEAIARQEGFGKPNTRATNNHNPGNLNWGAFAKAHGATAPDDKGYAVFPSNAVGYAALTALLQSKSYKGLTVYQTINRYCPSKDVRIIDGKQHVTEQPNNSYIHNVCDWCELTADTVIDPFVVPTADQTSV